MKTKFQILAAVALFAAMTNVAIAGGPGSNGTNNNSGSVNLLDNTNSTQNMLGYHHSSGGGDGAFSGNLINIGVGFVSGEGSLYNGSGYSSSVGPAFEASYERALNSKFGVGVNISYQTAKETYTGQTFDPVTFATINYTDTYKLSLLQFCARFAYHFSAGDKFDPYIGAMLGYCTISDSYTTTDPNATGSSSTASLTGVEFGGYGGARYFFSDHVGAWAEIQYAVASFKIDLGSGVSATQSINPCTVFNLGICFKF